MNSRDKGIEVRCSGKSGNFVPHMWKLLNISVEQDLVLVIFNYE